VAGSNYEVNIQLNVKKINQQLNNLERRIKKLNDIAMGQKGVGKAALKTERDKLALAIKTHRKEQQITREKQKQNKVEKDSAKVKKTPIPRHSGAALGPSSPLNITNQGSIIPGPSTVPKKAAGGSGVLSGALISGAFPLLFGQGPLGAAAGFAGGMIGGKLGGQTGGFAGGLIATAALTQIQQVIDGVAAVGNAFSKTSLDINQVTKSLGLVGTPSAKYLQVLERTQGKQAAYNESIKRLSRIVGDEGVRSLQEFGEASKQFGNDMNILMTRLAAGFAGFMNKINNEGIFGLGGLSKFTKPFERSNLLKRAELSKKSNVQDLIARRDEILNSGPMGIIKRAAELKDIEKKVIEQQRLNEKLQKESDLNEENKIRLKEMTKSISDRTQFLQNSLVLGTEEARIQQEVNKIVEAAKLQEIEISDTKKEQIADELRLQNQLEKTLELYKSIASTVESGLVDAIEGAIQGTKTLGEVATSVFNQISRTLLQFGVNSLLGSIPGIGSLFKADGGPVRRGGSYIVGERGPELFTPGSSGMITPNHALGGSTNVVVNVDASGSSVEGNEQQSRELGRLISVAVQSELLEQKRPGGLLT
tara:strand:- start:4909 stop:6684 length:1776 start_codon:yes stop_codon:yes gene_type:complete